MLEDFNTNIKEVNEFQKFQEYQPEPVPEPLHKLCKRASIKCKDLTAQELAKILDKLYDVNIQLESLFDKNELAISMNLRNVCLEQIFEYLTESYNIGYKATSFGYILYFPQLKTKIFAIDYHNFNRQASSSMVISSSELSGASNANSDGGDTRKGNSQKNYSKIDSQSQDNFWNNIEKTLNVLVLDSSRNSLSDNKDSNQISINREAGLVLVKAYPRTLQTVEAFLHQVNANSLKQIVIEAKILEITLNEEFNTGIQWDLLKYRLRATAFNVLTSKTQSTAQLYESNDNIASKNSPIASVLSAKVSNNIDFSTVLKVLSSQGKISVLSSPRIATLNNQRALIKYGDDKYYITNVTNLTTNNAQAGNTSQSGFSLTPFFSGIALDATPNIVGDNQIVMHIHPIITRVEDDSKVIQIDDKNTKIPIAKIQSREADTIVKANSGDIIILGGLTQGYFNMNSSGLPFEETSLIAKLLYPIRAKQQFSSRTELVILLKPTIIDTAGDTKASDLDKYIMDTNRL